MARSIGGSELADPRLRGAARRGRTAQAVGYAKVGPPQLPFEPRGAGDRAAPILRARALAGRAASPTEMMHWVIDEAERRGGDELYLSVFVDNHRARRFYER